MSNTQWREYLVDLTSGEAKEIIVKGKANMIIVRNPDSANVVHMDLNKTIGVSSDYEATAPFDGWGFLIRPFEIRQAYLIASADITKVRVYEVYTENPLQLIQNMAQAPTGAVQITATVGLKPGDLSIEAGTKHLNVDVQSLPGAVAQEGVDNTGIAQLNTGSGIRGWLSGIYNSLSSIIGAAFQTTGSAAPSKAIQLGASDGTNIQSLKVQSSTYPWLKTCISNGTLSAYIDTPNSATYDPTACSSLFTIANNLSYNGTQWERMHSTNNALWSHIKAIENGLVVKPGTTCTIYNITCTNADTEYSQALPAAVVRKLSMSMQANDAAFRIAYAAGKVATPTAPYINIPAGGGYQNDNIELAASTTIYFASATAGKVMQIEVWT